LTGETHATAITYHVLALTSLAGLGLALAGLDPAPLLALATLIVAAGFLHALAQGRFTVDLLMAVVGGVSLAYGLHVEGLIVLLLYGLAETLEHAVEGVARRRVLEAASIIPRRVLVQRDAGLVEEAVERLSPGDTVLVRVGEAVPADSRALSRGSVDLSHVTGEPLPVAVEPGDSVPSGALVVQGPLRLEVEERPGDSYVQRLVRLAEEAVEEKPRVARLLERYTPHITLLVLAGYAIAHQLLGPERALALLLVGCPSAFIVSSSLATSIAIAGLARRGALVRGGQVLEELWSYDVVVLDKTGTLTQLAPHPEQPVLSGPASGHLLGVVAGAAGASRHPVARALASLPVEPVRVEAVEAPGRGIVGEGLEILPGPEHPCGKTVLARVAGAETVLCLREEPLPGARRLVAYLRERGKRVVIASGDSRENVERIAKLLGVEEYYAGLTPEDKARLVERLKGEGLRVVYAGDGINDAVALARAHVGIAVGGIDLVREAADAVAPGGAGHVLDILCTAERHRRMIRDSFATAILLKAVAGLLGLAGAIALPLVALLGDDGSTLLGAAAASRASIQGGCPSGDP